MRVDYTSTRIEVDDNTSVSAYTPLDLVRIFIRREQAPSPVPDGFKPEMSPAIDRWQLVIEHLLPGSPQVVSLSLLENQPTWVNGQAGALQAISDLKPIIRSLPSASSDCCPPQGVLDLRGLDCENVFDEKYGVTDALLRGCIIPGIDFCDEDNKAALTQEQVECICDLDLCEILGTLTVENAETDWLCIPENVRDFWLEQYCPEGCEGPLTIRVTTLDEDVPFAEVAVIADPCGKTFDIDCETLVDAYEVTGCGCPFANAIYYPRGVGGNLVYANLSVPYRTLTKSPTAGPAAGLWRIEATTPGGPVVFYTNPNPSVYPPATGWVVADGPGPAPESVVPATLAKYLAALCNICPEPEPCPTLCEQIAEATAESIVGCIEDAGKDKVVLCDLLGNVLPADAQDEILDCVTPATWTAIRIAQVCDLDAQAYLARVEATDGDYLEQAYRDAVCDLVLGLKADGLWNALADFVPLIGARTLAGALVPLKGKTPLNIGFVTGDYVRKQGLKGDGTTKYLNTRRNINEFPQDSIHGSVYVHTQQTLGASGAYLGGGASSVNGAIGILRLNTGNVFQRNRNNTNNDIGTSGAGFIGHSRSGSANYTARINSTDQTITQASQAPGSAEIFALAQNALSGGMVPTPATFTDGRIACYTIGTSLTLSTLQSRVDAFIAAVNSTIP